MKLCFQYKSIHLAPTGAAQGIFSRACRWDTVGCGHGCIVYGTCISVSRLIIKRNESKRNFDQPGLNGKEKEVKNIMRSRSVVTGSRSMKELKEQGIKLRDLDL